ncbi:CGNR zinc finger domain-containing protein [Ochrobactrum sp. GPK 3]|uniref:CGNR zinc finger domain-containing protein n=1 Tax=Brucella sp. 22210 TaxID=3453892 RepID=UPI003138575E
MSFSWTPHRFSGGALALDIANSIILRGDAARSVDRFAEPANLKSFAHAAATFCAEKDLPLPLVPVGPENLRRFLSLREAIDSYFRAFVRAQADDRLLADLLECIADVLRQTTSPMALEQAAAHSALRLMAKCQSGADADRLKICANCGWLFLDQSRNRSRVWCDMTVCGNRAKASRHYYRNREVEM